MKVLFVACVFCFVAVLGVPDSLLKLGDPKLAALDAALANEIYGTEIPTTSEPKTRKTSTPQGTVSDRTRLVSDLFTEYNKKVNPDDVKLEFGVALIDFRVRAEANSLDSYVWLRLVWQDSRLQWDPTAYGGVEVLRFDSKEVWIPDVTLYNSADPVNMINCWASNVLIYSNGTILQVPPCKMVSQCNFSLKKEPYGQQTCTMKFGSWTFDGNVLDLQFYGGTKELDLSTMMNSSGFEIVSTTAERHDNYYPCCPEPYPDLTFNMTIKRIPGDELFNKL